jgi:hypothetical protein
MPRLSGPGFQAHFLRGPERPAVGPERPKFRFCRIFEVLALHLLDVRFCRFFEFFVGFLVIFWGFFEYLVIIV